jgi:putative thioredoxin
VSDPEPIQSAARGAVDLSGLVNRKSPPEADGAAPDASVTVPELVIAGTDENFGEILELSRRVPIVIDLWAEWCGPCKQLSPILEKLAREHEGSFVLVKVDVDANPQLSQAFQAQSIPQVTALVAGQPVQMFTGALPEQQVREVLAQLLQLAAQNGVTARAVVAGADAPEDSPPGEPEAEPLSPLHQAAYDAIERADYAAAITAYETAIAQDPRDALAVAGLAQVRLLDRLQGSTQEEIRSAAANGPHDIDAQLAVADLDLSGGHVDDAFDRLLGLFPALDQDDRNRVRERLVELFEVVGTDDARVIAARRRLASLLF